jgi:hypothetical protein
MFGARVQPGENPMRLVFAEESQPETADVREREVGFQELQLGERGEESVQ